MAHHLQLKNYDMGKFNSVITFTIMLILMTVVDSLAAANCVHVLDGGLIHISLSHDDLQTLSKIRNEFLLADKRNPTFPKRRRRSEGDSVMAFNNSYSILNMLGEGSEGVVYEALNSSNELVTLKEFSRRVEATDWVKLLRDVQPNGFAIAEVTDLDPYANVVIFKHIRGLPLKLIFESGLSLGMRPSLIGEIENLYNSIQETNFLKRDFNFIFDFDTGMLVLIDPK